jgi:hypothetical protein
MTAERPLSKTQVRMLRLVREGEPYDRGAYGMSGHAGVESTLHSLERRGLLATLDREVVITAAGRVALMEISDED